MLIAAKSMRELDFPALMEIYEEGNQENGADNWPELPEGQQMLLAEQGFRQYLTEIFFPTPGAVYCIWQAEGRYVSALRLEPYRDGVLLEALETAPAERRRGYAGALIRAVQAALPDKKIYSHVGKRNTPSLNVHEACGFRRIQDWAVYIDGSVNRRSWTLAWEQAPSGDFSLANQREI